MSNTLPEGAQPFEFRGNANEWFGIWIVNLALTFVTIGIYSAWAKVRTKKYFTNNTYVEERNFDYHATGGQILKGRLIVVAAVVVFQLISAALPILGLVLLLGLLVAYLWLIVRAMQFNARMTSFSNVRFGFNGSMGQAALLFILYPIAMALTLFTTFPIWDRAVKRFSTDNASLGQARFSFGAGLGAFYKAFGIAIAWVVLVALVGMALFGLNLMSVISTLENAESNPVAAFGLIGFIYFLFFVAFLPARFIYQALVRNELYNTATLEGGHRFVSNVTAPQLLWLAVSNMVVVVCTLFLMLPWAQVRMAKYLAAHTGFIAAGSLDQFVDQQLESTSAIGDAYTDFEGIDVGLPV